jgi:hypothetical protein
MRKQRLLRLDAARQVRLAAAFFRDRHGQKIRGKPHPERTPNQRIYFLSRMKISDR